MHYWIDGYNLLFRLSSKQPLETRRKDLILHLNRLANTLDITISAVFDNSRERDEDFDVRSHYDRLEIVFTSRGKTADDYLLEISEENPHPKHLCIVTSDKELAGRIRAQGSTTLSLGEFLRFLDGKQKKRRKTRPEEIRDSNREIARLLKIFEEKLSALPPNFESFS